MPGLIPAPNSGSISKKKKNTGSQMRHIKKLNKETLWFYIYKLTRDINYRAE